MSGYPPAFITFCKHCGKQMEATGIVTGYVICWDCKNNPRRLCSCLASGKEEDIENCQICQGQGTVLAGGSAT